MARGLELDWVVVRVQPLRKMVAVGILGLIAAALVFFAYKSLNFHRKPVLGWPSNAPPTAEPRRKPTASGSLAPENRIRPRSARTCTVTICPGRTGRCGNPRSQRADTLSRHWPAPAAKRMVGVGQFFSLEGRVELQRAGQTVGRARTSNSRYSTAILFEPEGRQRRDHFCRRESLSHFSKFAAGDPPRASRTISLVRSRWLLGESMSTPRERHRP